MRMNIENEGYWQLKVESEAQSIVADIRIYEGILMNVPAVIYCFLAGSNNNNKMIQRSLKEQLGE